MLATKAITSPHSNPHPDPNDSKLPHTIHSLSTHYSSTRDAVTELTLDQDDEDEEIERKFKDDVAATCAANLAKAAAAAAAAPEAEEVVTNAPAPAAPAKLPPGISLPPGFQPSSLPRGPSSGGIVMPPNTTSAQKPVRCCLTGLLVVSKRFTVATVGSLLCADI